MITAIVPTYNSGEYLDRCVAATLAEPEIAEMIVLDGGSEDGAPQRADSHERVRLIVAPELGPFQRLNLGLAEARDELVMILNDDAFVDPGTPRRLAAALAERPRAALAGAGLRGEDGEPQKSGGFYRTLSAEVRTALGSKRRRSVAREGVQKVTMIPLCCVLTRRSALRGVGGIDERFGFYFDDEDICRRLDESGYEMVVDWDAGAVHVGGGSTRQRDPAGWFAQFQRARMFYLRKHYPHGWRLFAVAWALRARLHALAWRVRGRLAGDADDARRAREWSRAFTGSSEAP